MQLALGLFSGGGAAAAGAGAAAAGSGALGILSGVTSVFGMLGSLAQGASQAASYREQAVQAEFDAKNEEAKGLQKETQLKRELLRALGENDVAFAAGGVDIGAGLPAENRAEAEKRATTEINIDRSSTEARVAMQRARASGYLRLASSASAASVFSALGMAAGTGLRTYARG